MLGWWCLSSFQSLFSWNLPSDDGRAAGDSREGKRVSILVFVELALGLEVRAVIIQLSVFQSLFSWNLPSDS